MKIFRLTIRISIVSLITTLIVLSGSIIVTTYYLGSKNSVYLLANNMMKEIAKYVSSKTQSYLAPAMRNNEQLKNLFESGVLQTEYNDKNLNYFRKIVSTNPEFVMVYYGDESGNLFMAKKMPDKSITYRWVTQKKDKIITQHQHSNPKYYFTFPKKSIFDLENGYDPRKRIWYKTAKTAKKGIWTKVYTFASDNKPGISNSTPVYNKKNELQGVLSIDVGVIELSYFLNTLKIGKNGKAFILNKDNKIIALPISHSKHIYKLFESYQENGKNKLRIGKIENIEDKDIAASFREYLKKTRSSQKTFTFQQGKKNYLALYTPFPKKSGLQWVIGIIIPEDDIMAGVNKNNQRVLFISLGLIFFTILIGYFFSHSISKPLSKLSQDMEEVKHFKLEPKKHINSSLVEVNQMSTSFENMKKGLLSFQKYVPADLVAQLIQMQKEAVIEGERKKLTIFFSDIAGFTGISEKLSPEKLVEHLGEYFEAMTGTILKEKGTVDKYIGDAVMAFWGAPSPIKNHAVHACHAALDCQKKLNKLFKSWADKKSPSFYTRIGINTGEVIVGNMGYEKRMDYTVVGDSVNLASRLEGLNKFYGTNIIISQSTFEEAEDYIETRLLDFVAVKGKKQGQYIYQLVTKKDEINQATRQFIQKFEEGIEQYFARQWHKALSCFQETLEKKPNDKPSLIFIERCKKYAESPPGHDWTGVHHFHIK